MAGDDRVLAARHLLSLSCRADSAYELSHLDDKMSQDSYASNASLSIFFPLFYGHYCYLASALT